MNASIEVGALGGIRKWPITFHADEQWGLNLILRFTDFVGAQELAESIAVAVNDVVPGIIELDRVRAVAFATKPRISLARLGADRAAAFVDALTAALADV